MIITVAPFLPYKIVQTYSKLLVNGFERTSSDKLLSVNVISLLSINVSLEIIQTNSLPR